MKRPKYEKGDLVRHRGSGEKAVVIAQNTFCETHGIFCELSLHDISSCRMVFNGTYTVKYNFDKEAIVFEFEIEREES